MPALGEVLTEDPTPGVRRVAVRALATLRSEEARWTLEEVAALDFDESVRQAAARALAQWR